MDASRNTPDLIELVRQVTLSEDRLADLLNDLVVSGNKRQMQQQFAKLLRHTIRDYGFEPNRRSYHKLAGQIPQWQDDGRLLPYEPLLVQSWFEGTNIPEQAAWQALHAHLSDDARTGPEQTNALLVLDALHGALSTNHFAKVREASKKVADELGYKTVMALSRDLSAIIRNPVYRALREDAHDDSIVVKPHPDFISSVLQAKRRASAAMQHILTDALEALYDQRGIDSAVSDHFEALKRAFTAGAQAEAKTTKTQPHSSELSRTAALRVKTLQGGLMRQTDIARELDLLTPSKQSTPFNYRLNGSMAFTLEELSQLDALCEQHRINTTPPLVALYFHQCRSKAEQFWQTADAGETPPHIKTPPAAQPQTGQSD